MSTTEADYVSMGDGVKEGLFMNDVLKFLVPSARNGKIEVLEDNEGAIALAENQLSSCKSTSISDSTFSGV